MMAMQRQPLRHVLAMAMLVVGLACSANANESATVTSEPGDHPLSWIFSYASSRSDYIQKNIRDYSCRLIKRERIDGKLQKHQFIEVLVRCEPAPDSEADEPMSVFMQYLAPGTLKDRRILYVQGENNGMMLIRKGGRTFKYVKLEVDPNGAAAKKESNYPITNIGFDKIIERLLESVTEDIKNDPTGANTQVSHFRNAKVSDRVCTHINVVHPKRGIGIQFHKASLYVDDELHVPIRLVVYGWPPSDGGDLPLLEEYTYVNLKLNVGLTDEDFSKTKLDSKGDDKDAKPKVATSDAE
jgi:hypothetical protein